jgi:hypothetical protein
MRGKPIYAILHNSESFVHLLTNIAKSDVKNIYFPIDLLKPTVDSLKMSVDSLKMSVDLLKMSVDLPKSPVNLLESALGPLKP